MTVERDIDAVLHNSCYSFGNLHFATQPLSRYVDYSKKPSAIHSFSKAESKARLLGLKSIRLTN